MSLTATAVRRSRSWFGLVYDYSRATGGAVRKNCKTLPPETSERKHGARYRFFLPGLLGLLFSIPCNANAGEEITLIAPGGARAALEVLLPRFESKSGNKVKA